MLQQQVVIINNFLLVVDALCVIAAGHGAFYWSLFASDGIVPIDSMVFIFTMLSVMFINSYTMGKFRLYSEVRPQNYLVFIWAVIKAVFLDFVFLSAGLYFFKNIEYSRDFVFYFATLTLIMILGYRIGVQWYLDKISVKGFNVIRILVVGEADRAGQVERLLDKQMSWGHQIVGRLQVGKEAAVSANPVLGTLDDLPEVVTRYAIDEVVFAISGDRSVKLEPYLRYCHKVGIPLRILPSLWSHQECFLSMESCQGVPFLTMRPAAFNASGLLYKRLLDIVGGLVGTLLFLIMYPIVAVAIKLDSPGPVLFKQQRMGQHGRVFKLIKFRTMCVDAEQRKAELVVANQMHGAIFKVKNDPRITRVGRFLRRTSIDEFPQFINVLCGQMSLVGTRPPTLDEVEKYRPEHLKRISAKPGLTGLWQVSGRNKITDFDKIVELDCQYLDDWRFFHDLKILVKTVSVVLQRKGAI
ncbi:exopolysaccharide biosynthesis polyprenyl glycosylphosphotransferase [Desulfosarcina variabilis str. Montpellier]|uniref:sugar transferase n=1 Tax=Desulfosarcina variabilis TaxID=2300 RepID=UPI003AFAB226